jgi:hypothetical protein
MHRDCLLSSGEETSCLVTPFVDKRLLPAEVQAHRKPRKTPVLHANLAEVTPAESLLYTSCRMQKH